jgi:hypothetical protein
MAWQCCLGSIRIAGKAACDHRHANVSENHRLPVIVTSGRASSKLLAGRHTAFHIRDWRTVDEIRPDLPDLLPAVVTWLKAQTSLSSDPFTVEIHAAVASW